MKVRPNNVNPPLTNGLPTFEVVANGKFAYPVPNKDGTENIGTHLEFVCPKCRNINAHGGVHGKPGVSDGPRESHCNCWDRYYIVEVPK
jgi:hypothetical protein